jgi:phosphoribosylformylglycinamidine synthase
MAALLPCREKQSLTAGIMTFGYDPALAQADPYRGAKVAVREALAKFACLGGDPWQARLSFQEYFERMESPESWAKPAAALLGALEAQLRLGVPAIGGKDSMSGTYRDAAGEIAVPPTLVAFAAGSVRAERIRSGVLIGGGGTAVILLRQPPEGDQAPEGAQTPAEDQAPEGEGPDEWDVFKANMEALAALTKAGLVRAAYPVGAGGVAAALALMAFGNDTGVEALPAAFAPAGPGSVLVELEWPGDSPAPTTAAILAGTPCWALAAFPLEEAVFRVAGGDKGEGEEAAEVPLARLRRAYESPLSTVYPQTAAEPDPEGQRLDPALLQPKTTPPPRRLRVNTGARPLALIPVFPGTNCEWDMERAFREAGAETRLLVFRNRSREDIGSSIRDLADALGEAQILALAGGFSAGDEPDGSGKFIANALRAGPVAEALTALLEKRDGLILGICNGFQALIKLGLVPYGRFCSPREGMPTLTFNALGRHVSRMVCTRVMSRLSPWLALEETGALQVLPVSHGEGRLVLGEEEARALFAAGQVPFCYAGSDGFPTLAEPDNPNGSAFAVEALTSPDGRVLGKMAHSERRGPLVHINIPGNKVQRLFEAGVAYFA